MFIAFDPICAHEPAARAYIEVLVNVLRVDYYIRQTDDSPFQYHNCCNKYSGVEDTSGDNFFESEHRATDSFSFTMNGEWSALPLFRGNSIENIRFIKDIYGFVQFIKT